MSSLAQQPVLFALVFLLVGVALGVLLAWLAMRDGSAAANEAALREQFDEYKEEVHEHFGKTADLFRDMTEKYRDVYEHLAEGAQTFGKDLDEAPALHIVPRQALEEARPVPGQMPPDVASPTSPGKAAAADKSPPVRPD